ncbi:MAG TPA: hypothetical protein VIR63_02475 [Pontiella sp.]
MFKLFKSATSVVIVDAIALNESLGVKGKVPPRNQLQMLRRLSRFAQREKLSLVAVLSGSPLNKAPSGKKFEGITVLYSKSLDLHAKFLVKTAKLKGGVLISGNAAVEKIAGKGLKMMHISTFRKAFDVGSENENERSENNRPRGNRPPRRRPQKPSNNKNNNTQDNNEPKKERPVKKLSDADAINELIDLVD